MFPVVKKDEIKIPKIEELALKKLEQTVNELRQATIVMPELGLNNKSDVVSIRAIERPRALVKLDTPTVMDKLEIQTRIQHTKVQKKSAINTENPIKVSAHVEQKTARIAKLSVPSS